MAKAKLRIETHEEDGQGHWWSLELGSNRLAQSPVGVYWPDALHAKAAGDVAVAKVGASETLDRTGSAPLAEAIADELIGRGVLPSDFKARHGLGG